MAELTEQVRELIRKPVFAYAATTFEDGEPHSTPVWIDLVDGRPLFNTVLGNVKHGHLRRDPRVALAFHDPDNPYAYVEIRGTVELTTDGAEDMIDRLSSKYLGQDTYPWRQPGQRRVNVFVNPTRISGTGA
jgi:PPOX class probable F420-dependent enzyme